MKISPPLNLELTMKISPPLNLEPEPQCCLA